MSSTQDWLTLCAVIVALFGPYIYDYFKNRNLESKHDKTLICVINDFISDLERILKVRNTGKTKDSDKVIFDETSRSEMAGYMKIFETLILNNYQLSKNSHLRVIFFSHFQKNMLTISERTVDNQNGHLTVATVKKLLTHAEEAKKKGKS
ncbi:MAG: hypothetical protein P9L90_05350 [Candidatus Aadella gelida]|nr:hypothetical protein [Candidatus Aadella gelida]